MTGNNQDASGFNVESNKALNKSNASQQNTSEFDATGVSSADSNGGVQLKKNISVAAVKTKRNYSQVVMKYLGGYQQLTLREQLLVLGLVALFSVFLYVLVRWIPMQEQMREETGRLTKHNKSLKSLAIPDVISESSGSLQDQLDKAQAELDQLDLELDEALEDWVSLDDKASLQRLKLGISSLARKTGLVVVVNKPIKISRAYKPVKKVGRKTKPETKSKSKSKSGNKPEEIEIEEELVNPYFSSTLPLIYEYHRPGVQYEMRGSYGSFMKFIGGLSELPNQVSVGELDLSVQDLRTESGRETLNISLTIIL